MAALDYKELCRRSDGWQRQASDLDFLGEIALPQAELEHLLRSLGHFGQRVDEPELSFALAVAAVNWAYWRGVDEEESKGFRDSFMTHSLGYCDLRLWERLWGPAIEDAICAWSKQPPRFGTYRYVGLILRHAGVPHAKIPRLARLLQDIDREIGWPNAPAARDATLETHVVALFGAGCIGEHLGSDAGLAYLRSLCADLQFLRSQPRRSVPDLPGYRPGLLAALLANVDLGPMETARPSAPLPYVSFDLASGRIELVFDERCIRRGELSCDQWDRRLYDSRLDLGPGGVQPAAIYTGRLGGRTWTAKGWRYTDATAWALFRSDGRLATTHLHDDSVPAGEYMLVLTGSLNISALCPNSTDDGERILPDGTDCRVWNVGVREGDDGKLPGLRVSANAIPWLACINANGTSRWSQYDAVCTDAPVLRIGGWTARNSRRFRLIMSTAAGHRDLHPKPDPEGTATISLDDLPDGMAAEITLFPVGFVHGPRAPQNLRVLRFAGHITFQEGLWPASGEAAVPVRVSEGVRLEGRDGVRVQPLHGDELTLVVPPKTGWAIVTAFAGSASLPLRFPVRRGSFSFSDSPSEPAVFDRALVKEMCGSGGLPGRTFTISAIPAGAATLLVRNRQHDSHVWKQGLRLGSNGRLDLPATDLVDVIRNELGVWEVAIDCNGFEVTTGSVFVQPTMADLETGPWPGPVEQYLRLIRQPAGNVQDVAAMADVECIRQHAAVIARVDRTFGLSDVTLPEPFVSAAAVGWITRLDSLLSALPRVSVSSAGSWKAEMVEWLRAAPLPLSPRRWETAARALITDLEGRVDIAGPLSRLLAGIADPAIPDGLVHGWSCYAEAEREQSDADRLLLRAVSYFSHAARGAPPWSQVAERLAALSLLRAGAIPEFVSTVATFSPTNDCPGIDAACRAVVSILGLQQPIVSHQANDGLALSSREDDRLLAAALADGSEAWPRAADRCWVAAWLNWRFASIMRAPVAHREECRRIALRHEAVVPTRARERVTQELRLGTATPIRIGMECT